MCGLENQVIILEYSGWLVISTDESLHEGVTFQTRENYRS